MNLFASLEIGRKALFASRAALDITGNNIANVNTPGFMRRRIELSEALANRIGGLFVGGGVETERVRRVFDGLLHAQARGEEQNAGLHEAASAGLAQIEGVLAETGGGGIAAALDAFFGAFSTLAGDPQDSAQRRVVAARGDDLAATIRGRAQGLRSIQRSSDAAVGESIARINSLGREIADLNRKIQLLEPGQNEAAELRDARSLRIRELSALVDIQVAEGTNGSAHVALAGTGDALVVEDKAFELEIRRGADGFARVNVRRGGGLSDVTARIQGGKLGGLLATRDGSAAKFLAQLDSLAEDLVARVNAQHRAGVDGTGAAGGDFFAPTAPGVSAAETLALSPALLADPRRIAAGTSAAPGDGTNAAALAGLAALGSAALGGRTSGQLVADLQSEVGLDARGSAAAFATGRAALLAADERIQALSGVDLDEEAAALMQYQRSYEAAAKFLGVVNDMTKTALELVGP